YDIDFRLLCGECGPGCLSMEAQHHRAGIASVKTIAHNARPHPSRGPKLGDLFQQVVMRIKEKRKAWCEFINLETGFESRLDIGKRVSKCKRQLLYGRRARFPNVIAANRNGVPVGDVLRAKGECVCDQAKRRLRWKDVSSARNVLFQNVVLNGAVYFFKRNALFA